MRKMFFVLAMSLLTASFLLTNPLLSMANVRIPWEGPYYARIGLGATNETTTIHTDEWTAVPFYRGPVCVPDAFNLLDFFDFENALNCHSFMEGFEIKENEIVVPMQAKLKAVEPMPIYFAPCSVMQVAIGDGILTMPELEDLEGLRIGIATFYTETLHPSGPEELGGGAQQYMIEIVAKGYMAEDNSVKFELKYTWIHEDPANGDPGHGHAKIDFKTAKSAPGLKSQSKLAATWGEMKGKH